MGVSRRILNWYARLSPSHGRSAPPYEHVVQIGDPRLRKVSEMVPLEKIKSEEVQSTIRKLEYVLKKYNSSGTSAPQIGVNLRIFVMRLTTNQIARVPKELVRLRGMDVIPFTVSIHQPHMKVVNYSKVVHAEGCESVQGYEAEVPRYKEVQLTGYNEEGAQVCEEYRDWAARVAQHEMDHLLGKLYVDTMDRRTLTCTCWEQVNLAKGKLHIPFSPQ